MQVNIEPAAESRIQQQYYAGREESINAAKAEQRL